MADIPNRDTLETQLVRALAKFGGARLDALLPLLGDPPSVDNVPASFWRAYDDDLRALLGPFLAKVYTQGANAAPIPPAAVISGAGWSMPNVNAADWADKYTFDLVTGINATTRDLLATAVRDAIESGQTRAELADALTPAFGPARAEMIAVTEVTRAVAEGEALVIADLAKAGVEMVGTWQTAEDELVCSVCSPLDGVQAEGGVFTHPETGDTYELPPAHPRCRCVVGYTMAGKL